MTGAELAGQLESLGVDVNRHDGVCAGDLRGHDGGEADGTGAEHRQACPRRHPERVEHRAGTRLQTAAQWSEQLELHVAGHLDHVALGRQ